MKNLISVFEILFFVGAVVSAADGLSDESAAWLDQLELRSVVVLDGEYLFSLSDPENDRAFWISRGRSVAGLDVLVYDAERDLLTVRYGNVEKMLSLMSTRIRAAEFVAADGADAKNERSEAFTAAWEALAAMHLRWEALPDDLPPRVRALADHVAGASEDLENWLAELEATKKDADNFDDLLERGRVESGRYQMLYQYLERRAEHHPVFEREESVRIARAVNRLLQLYDPSR